MPLQVSDTADGEKEAVVKCARIDTCTREVLRHPEFADKVKLLKVRDHFIFSVESTGALAPLSILREAVKLLKSKCLTVREELEILAS